MADSRIENSPLSSISRSSYTPLTPFPFQTEKKGESKWDTGESSEKKGDLFPEIKRNLSLPEEGAEVDFDRPSFAAPREKQVSKPTLPQPELVSEAPGKTSSLWDSLPWPFGRSQKKSEEEETPASTPNEEKKSTSQKGGEPLIGLQRRLKAPIHTKSDQDELSHLPNQGGAVLAKLVGMITNYQTMSQLSELEIFSATNENLDEVRRKQFELVKEQIENRKDQENWSYRRELLEYFGISLGIFAGATMIGTGVVTGGASIVPGLQTLGGSAITLGAKIAGKYFDEKTFTPFIGAAGVLLSGWGIAKGMASLGSLPGVMGTASNATFKVSELIVGQKSLDTQANQYGISARSVKLQYQREDNQQTMQKIVGGFKSSKESSDLLGAATKALRTEDEVKSRIALGTQA
ncbi:MAG: hypothetical protein KDK76_01240 [Chlamydiia bacterium]|nr:hypothetical protein [Chlamydiia bacterium]